MNLKKLLVVLSGVGTFFVPAVVALAAPIISGMSATSVTSSSAQVAWITNELSDSRVAYDMTSGSYAYFSSSRCDGGGYVTSHCVSLSGLNPNTYYYTRLESMSSLAGTSAMVTGPSFMTSAINSGGSGGGTTIIPNPPSSVTATAGTGYVYVGWPTVTNATHYSIERSVSGGAYSALSSGFTPAYYTDSSSLTSGASYTYRVYACQTSVGCSTTGTVSNSAVYSSGTTLYPPSSVTASSMTGKIYVGWPAASGASKYTIYRSVNGGTFSLWYTNIANLYYEDLSVSQSNSYQYQVYSCMSDGTTCSTSYTASNSISYSGSNQSCTGLTLTLNDGKTTYNIGDTVNYTWTCTPGGTASNVSIWLQKPDGSSTLYNSGSGSATQTMGFGTSNLSAGTYILKACFDSTCAAVTASQTFTLTSSGAGTTIPSSPSSVTAATNTGYVYVGWPTVTNATHYSIERSVSGGAYSALSSGFTPAYYTDSSSLTSGASYTYRVYACQTSVGCSTTGTVSNSVAYSSGIASTATTTTSSSGSSAITIPGSPSSVTATANTGYVYVGWPTVTDATHYSIERSIGGAAYSYLSSGFASVYYNDSGVTSGTTYRYRVYACKSGYGCSTTGTESNSAAYGSNTTAVTGSIVDLIPPSVTNFGYYTQSDGLLRAGVSFSEAIDKTTVSSSSVYVIEVATGARVSGTPTAYYSGVDFLMSVPSKINYDYQLVIKNIKDSIGNQMGSAYMSSLFRSTAAATNTSVTVSSTIEATSTAYTATATTTAITATSTAVTGTNLFTTPTGAAATTQTKGTFAISTIDQSGAPVVSVPVNLWLVGGTTNYYGVTDVNGNLNLQVVSGEYYLDLGLPSDRQDLVRPVPVKIIVGANLTVSRTISFGKNIKKIVGLVQYSDLTPVAFANVGAYSDDGRGWLNGQTDKNGAFEFLAAGGTWRVNAYPPSTRTAWQTQAAMQTVVFAKDVSVESKNVTIMIPAANGTVIVQAVLSGGGPVSAAGVAIDSVKGTETVVGSNRIVISKQAGMDGIASFVLPPGKYYVRGFAVNDLYFNPEEQEFSVAAGATSNISIIFNTKQTVAETIRVSGAAMLEGRVSVFQAMIGAWSEKGGFRDAKTDADGKWSLEVPAGDRWHIRAAKEKDGYPYMSTEIVVEAVGKPSDLELVLTKNSEDRLPKPVAMSRPVEEASVIKMTDGAKVTVPANLTQNMIGGAINVEMKPVVEASSQAGSQVISTVYDVSMKDSYGKKLTSFDKDIEIELPYTLEELREEGVTEDTIKPSYFDEDRKMWIIINTFTLDKKRHVIVARVKHLTRFAIVSAADVTPPTMPMGISVIAKAGSLAIAWKNPSTDFDHSKIYRSLEKNNLGSVIATEVTGTGYTDSSTLSGVNYYYVVRSVDPAGNESVNTGQVSSVGVGVSSGGFTRNLKYADRGSDVTLLQTILVKEGFLGVEPTGFFGVKTKQAVIDLQEAYANELLTPAGLSSGSGFVGKLTRQKLTALNTIK